MVQTFQKNHRISQWRIKDFPDGRANLLINQSFPKNCMKMKEIGLNKIFL